MVNTDKQTLGIGQTWYINGSEYHIVDVQEIDGVKHYISDCTDEILDLNLLDRNDEPESQLHMEDPLYLRIMDCISKLTSGEVLNKLFNEYCEKFGRPALDMLCDYINAYCQSRPWPYNLYGVMKPDRDEYSGF